jgi:hypothetical protein
MRIAARRGSGLADSGHVMPLAATGFVGTHDLADDRRAINLMGYCNQFKYAVACIPFTLRGSGFRSGVKFRTE